MHFKDEEYKKRRVKKYLRITQFYWSDCMPRGGLEWVQVQGAGDLLQMLSQITFCPVVRWLCLEYVCLHIISHA